MNRRLLKEFRSLRLPWLVGILAGIVIAFRFIRGGPLESFLDVAPIFAFFGTILIASVLPFGNELQHRTLPLLLALPVSRARLWNEKLFVLALTVTTIVLVQLSLIVLIILTLAGYYQFQPQWRVITVGILPFATLLLATVCSAAFWTLIARSIIGGIVFCVSSQFLTGLGAMFAIHKIYGPQVDFYDPRAVVVVSVVGFVYAALFLWLGRRKFAGLELRDPAFGQATASSPRSGRRWWSDWLRCRPTSVVLNLIRKEILLQKPVLQIAVIFSACWAITFLLLLFEPARKDTFELIFNVITAFYVPLAVLLAGCVSLGEEKTIGLTTWHLTLPISSRLQWLVKLGVAAAIALVLGWGWPFLLALITSGKAEVGLLALRGGWQILLLFSAVVFVLSFWAGTLLANTVRAALFTVSSMVALSFCITLGVWCDSKLFGGLGAPLLTSITAHLQLSPDFFDSSPFHVLSMLFLGATALTALIQSYAQFRRSEHQNIIVIKYSLIGLCT